MNLHSVCHLDWAPEDILSNALPEKEYFFKSFWRLFTLDQEVLTGFIGMDYGQIDDIRGHLEILKNEDIMI